MLTTYVSVQTLIFPRAAHLTSYIERLPLPPLVLAVGLSEPCMDELVMER